MKGPVLAATAAALAISGCASGPKPSIAPVAPRSTIVVVPQVMAAQGLDGVIGAPATALTRRFGAPRIDLTEGDVRKLQFAGQTCVIDIYLYPVNAGAEPSATHIDARLRLGGAAVDGGACIREVERR